MAAALAFFMILPPAAEPLIADVTNAHLRSIASGHVIDVASTDRHTVKPWLATHADLSPPVADFAAQGFKLIGGRVDFLEGERAAVTVYRHGAHIVNVFAWANYGEAPAGLRDAQRLSHRVLARGQSDVLRGVGHVGGRHPRAGSLAESAIGARRAGIKRTARRS